MFKMSTDYLNSSFLLHTFHFNASSSTQIVRQPLLRVSKTFKAIRLHNPRPGMEMEMVNHQSAVRNWSRQPWNNDNYCTMMLPSDHFSYGPVETDDENADVEMLDLNDQIHDTTSPTAPSTSTSTSSTICADKQVDTTPSPVLDIVPDSSAILDALATMSIDAHEQTPTEQNATAAVAQASTALHTNPCTASQRRKQRLLEYYRGRLAAGQWVCLGLRSIDAVSQAARIRAKPSRSIPDVLGPTNTHKFSRETSISKRRQRALLAQARGFRRARVGKRLSMRPTGNAISEKLRELYAFSHEGAALRSQIEGVDDYALGAEPSNS
jgi:hypothetical protein